MGRPDQSDHPDLLAQQAPAATLESEVNPAHRDLMANQVGMKHLRVFIYPLQESIFGNRPSVTVLSNIKHVVDIQNNSDVNSLSSLHYGIA